MRKALTIIFFAIPNFALASGTVNVVSHLDFGTVTPATLSGGTVTISTAGAVSYSGVTGVSARNGEIQYILDNGVCKCRIDYYGVPTSLTLTGSNGGTLVVSNFTEINANFSGGNQGQGCGKPWKSWFEQPPYATWYVGATANLTPETKPGTYVGTFVFSVGGQQKDNGGTLTNKCQANQNAYDVPNATNVVQVKIIVNWPLAVTQTQAMNFGKIHRPVSGACTATISTAGARTGSCSMQTSPIGNGVFKISGMANAMVSYSLPSSVNIGGMTLTSFTASEGNTLNSSGELNVSVGATLNIPNNQATGIYSGSYTFTVDY
jgi:hypothetical protein